jgi:hypothetical protein
MKLPNTPAFPMWKQQGAAMVKKDLDDAGIPYCHGSLENQPVRVTSKPAI